MLVPKITPNCTHLHQATLHTRPSLSSLVHHCLSMSITPPSATNPIVFRVPYLCNSDTNGIIPEHSHLAAERVFLAAGHETGGLERRGSTVSRGTPKGTCQDTFERRWIVCSTWTRVALHRGCTSHNWYNGVRQVPVEERTPLFDSGDRDKTRCVEI